MWFKGAMVRSVRGLACVAQGLIANQCCFMCSGMLIHLGSLSSWTSGNIERCPVSTSVDFIN